jgi:hypothetical protein
MSPQVIDEEAKKVLTGFTNPEALVRKYGPKVTDMIMMRIQKGQVPMPAETEMASSSSPDKAPNPLHVFIPAVLEHYHNPDRSEEDEAEFLGLIKELKKDRRFQSILKQYDTLIELYPDRTEAYEEKAMKDFYELMERLSA